MITIIKGSKYKKFKEVSPKVFKYGREIFKDSYLVVENEVLRLINNKGKLTFLPC